MALAAAICVFCAVFSAVMASLCLYASITAIRAAGDALDAEAACDEASLRAVNSGDAHNGADSPLIHKE